MIRKSYAKINLAINILNKNEDGYHELDMIMSKINLYDKIYIDITNDSQIKITCTNKFVPCDDSNLVYRAAQAVLENYQINKGLNIHIAKYIPLQAGLGGGSANAATVIDMLNELFTLNMTIMDKINLSKSIGYDIPFFFYDNICRVKGYGEIIKPLNINISKWKIILVKPNRGLSTKQVYENVNLTTCAHPDITKVIEALEQDNYDSYVKEAANSLEQSAINIKGIINTIMNELYDLGVDKCMVCGSGSTVVAFSQSLEVCTKIKKAHQNKKNFVYLTNII
ncbi:MAG: 4-(cytidine 5'-diphospho)-2-C-methyl-D-erythritol kinase [Bacilli bacterium]|jgi:4-diphosphocytidyl-2C-methyl-D-erythritol kinase|nr:4-(cytidine 5'-diphospho)-2-C-methyl-D-erythritol kinase [Bacilli bacterium]